ncbi:hypothetical protein J7K19_07885 [bacterium]|nr:hypothetical protein [bacterium]
MRLPNIWGEGILFAFSGCDGPTDWQHPFVGGLLGDRVGIEFYTQYRRRLWLRIESKGREDGANTFEKLTPNLVCSDLLDVVAKPAGMPEVEVEVRMVFLTKDVGAGKVVVLPGTKAQELRIVPVTTMDGRGQQEQRDHMILQSSPSEYTVLVWEENATETMFAYAFDATDIRRAEEKARQALTCDFEQAVQEKLQFFTPLPQVSGLDELEERTYYKAFSVLKVNIESPQGEIAYHWATPDRFPHRHMWLWDSAFQALAMKYISAELAEAAIKAVLSKQKPDGFIPHMMTPDPSLDSHITQPPILAWAAWDIYRYGQNRDFLAHVYPRLKAYLEWDLNNKDANGNGLLEWVKDEEDVLCHCAESGMDNSPRFDLPGRDDAVDLNAFIAAECAYLAKMADVLGKGEERRIWLQRRQKMIRLINQLLWDSEDEFYYDRSKNGDFVRVKTEASFAPLFAKVADEGRAQSLVRHLKNPQEFWRLFPVSSVAADEPSFCDDMWRGPTWVNYNYLIIQGLRQYGYNREADEIAEKTLQQIAHWYGQTGVIWEYYDSEGKTPPVYLHRKRGFGVIRDYGWTAAIYILLVLEKISRE